MEGQSFFARTRAVPRPERYAIVAVRPSERDLAFRVAAGTQGFCAVMDVGSEVTMLLPQERWVQVAPVFWDPAAQTDFRVVTLESDVPLEAVGYVSTITGALARAGVAVAVLSAFSCDHLIVRERDLGQCLEILQKAGAAVPGRT
jgi:hypothetical protein